MGCCGSSRRRWRTTIVTGDVPNPDQGASATGNYEWRSGRVIHQKTAPVRMIYQGQGKIVVVGPHTGRRYRFANPGAILEVDGRDAQRMRKLRQLRLLEDPGKTT